MRRAIDAGLLDVLGLVNSRDEFARRLLAIGLGDRSDTPLPEARSMNVYEKGNRVRFPGFCEPDPYSPLRVGTRARSRPLTTSGPSTSIGTTAAGSAWPSRRPAADHLIGSSSSDRDRTATLSRA